MTSHEFDQLLKLIGDQHRLEVNELKAEIRQLQGQLGIESEKRSVISVKEDIPIRGYSRQKAWTCKEDFRESRPQRIADISDEECSPPCTITPLRAGIPNTMPDVITDIGGSPSQPSHIHRHADEITKFSSKNLMDDEVDTPRSESNQGMLQPFYEDSVPAYLHDVLKEATASGRQVVKGYVAKSLERGYDVAIGFFIFLNAIFIGWQVGRRAKHGNEDPPLFDYIGAAIFCLLFGGDLCYRFWKQRCGFFHGAYRNWNIFDSIIVALMFVEELLRYVDDENHFLQRFSFLRMFRLLRFIRILHVVQSLAVFREFRLLVETMLIGSRAMFWVVLIAIFIAYVLGIALTEGAYEECAGQRMHEADSKLICKHFGRIENSILSIYEAMFGGVLWGELMDSLLKMNALYPVLFVTVISFVIIIMTNVVTALVLKMVGELAQGPDAKIREKKETIAELTRIFNTLDPNRSGDISLEELRNAFDEPRLVGLLASLHLDVADDAKRFFEMLDRDGTGVIPQKEFVLGCLRLKGEAKAVDILRLQQNVLELGEVVKSLKDCHDERGTRRTITDESPTRRITSPKLTSAKSGQLIGPSIKRNVSSSLNLASNEVNVQDNNPIHLTQEVEPMLAAGGGVRIPKTEERAMSLKQMSRLRVEIRRRCLKEGWADMRTGASLEPHAVNLYHLNYNHICPLTTPEGVVLRGLKKQRYEKGQRIAQYDEKSATLLPIAEGIVQETVTGTEVQVTIRRGLFFKPDASSQQVLPIFVDDNACGMPSYVESPNALSYKELVSSGPLAPKWFCCHWWGEQVFDFIACCESHTKLRDVDVDEASFWVCAYANCQHDLGADITIDPEHSSFRRAMRLAEGILLVLDQDATPFRRIWCDFELYKTISIDKKPLDIITVHEDQPRLLSESRLPHETAHYKSLREQKFPIRLLVEGMKRLLEDGAASVELDKKRILDSMARDVPMTGSEDSGHDDRLNLALKRANNALHAYFALCSWSFAVNAGIVEDFDQDNRGSLNLAEILSQDQERQRLQMTLAHSTRISDNDLRVLAQGLPPNLFELTLSFDGCPHIRDAGLAVLVERLPRCLRGLKLDMSNCKEITDIGIEKLMGALPESIECLELYFANCREISEEGAFEIIENLPKNTVRLAVSLLGTKVNKDFESAAALRKFAATQKGWRKGAAAMLGVFLPGST